MFYKLFSFQDSRFIFDLFLENKISSFYLPVVSNNFTNKYIETGSFESKNSSKNIHIVKDVPSYLNFSLQKLNSNIKFRKVQQYKGYLVNINGFKDVTTFINDNLNKRNRKNLISKKNKLYKNHKISSKFFFGEISKDNYQSLFKAFYRLLKVRFNEKRTYNRYLSNWDTIQEVTYQKILEKEASLHVIFDNHNPIGITLNFHKGDIVFSHIQTYDINYSKYNMGDISMLHHIEWLITNKIAVFDLSMGKTYYKEKWCNHEYNFIYHIFYKKNTILSRVKMQIIVQELKLLQFLRDKNIIGKLFMFDKLLYTYKNRLVK
ncbi:GNAT family N-acetyltransferase [Flavivirga amylovorans]|uniref:GNAT family N-acetyltransferase n=1 Tax=Flavivirga amylovorans TaxID=870486 RepID=A0ABT8X1Q9_9FLAO|nr:GNAT family N-acetyltransferase [Flavivirga amylovorans]MDO5987889.1 GNAT family N-acetyltransferase [Flavivirga amylovorans]